jgi:hypothetical protein
MARKSARIAQLTEDIAAYELIAERAAVATDERAERRERSARAQVSKLRAELSRLQAPRSTRRRTTGAVGWAAVLDC